MQRTVMQRTVMQHRRWWRAALAVSVSACASGASQASPGASEPVSSGGSAQFTAGFIPVNSALRGSLDLDSGVSPGQSRVVIQLRNGQPGAELGWQVRTGRCEAPGDPVGAMAAYRPIAVRADGTASLTATLSLTFDQTQKYHAAVFAPRNNASNVVACGNLALR